MALQSHHRSRHSKRKGHRRHHRHGRHITPTHETFKHIDAPWPDEFTVKLDYRVFFDTSGISSTKAVYQYRGNGPYDPEVAVGGGQPRGWDQWITKYSYYFCSASGCTATISSQGNAGGVLKSLVVFALWPADSSITTGSGSVYTDGERAYAKFGQYEMQAEGPVSLTQYMSTKKIYGVESARINETDYAASVTALPSTQWYWNISAQPLDTANAVYISGQMNIVYYVTFYARKDPADAIDDESKEVKKKDPHPFKSHVVRHVEEDDGTRTTTDLLTYKVVLKEEKKEAPKKVHSKK